MIKNIKPEGLPFTYFSNTDLAELIRLQSQIEQFNLPMINRIKNSSDIRAILISLSMSNINNNYLYYLYWHNGEDLKSLDEKVAKDTFTSKEFEHSIITREQKTKCLKCGKTWHTLVMEGDLYFGKKELREVKEQQNTWKHCPDCGAMFRIYVVKIL